MEKNNERPERPHGEVRRRRKVCQFCADKVEHIDYKDAAKLRKFISERGKILPRRMTGTCAMRVLWIYTVFAFSHTMETLYLSYPVTWLITFTVDIICYVILKNRLIRHVNELEAASASADVQ